MKLRSRLRLDWVKIYGYVMVFNGFYFGMVCFNECFENIIVVVLVGEGVGVEVVKRVFSGFGRE